MSNIISIPDNLNYQDASNWVLDNLNLDNLQISSYNNFLMNIIKKKLSKTYTHKEEFTVSFDKWWLDSTKTEDIETCKNNRLDHELSLKALVTITLLNGFVTNAQSPITENSLTVEAEITRFPILTEKGSFIIRGNNRVLISHVERADKVIAEKAKTGITLSLNTSYTDRISLSNKLNIRISSASAKGKSEHVYDYLNVLEEFGCADEDSVISVVGMNRIFMNKLSSNQQSDDTNVDSIYKVMRMFRMDYGERKSINMKTSFIRNIVDNLCGEDVVLSSGKVIIKEGETFTPEIAEKIQEDGIKSVKISVKGIIVPVLSNGFVNTERLFNKYGLEIPDEFKIETINPISQEPLKPYYLDCNLDEFMDIYNEFKDNRELLEDEIRLSTDRLIGTHLLKDDILSLISLYSRYTMKLLPLDDIDSLENKKIVNIADIFGEGLEKAITGRVRSEKASAGKEKSLMSKISTIRRNLINNGSNKLQETKFDLDCGDWTITKDTISIYSSLFNIEDSTNPLSQINHKRRLSLQEVDGRDGGVKSKSSETKPRSVNPSYIGRVDCVETPEGHTVGLVRQVATLSYLNEFGELEAPYFKVDHENKVIDTSKVYYMTYDEEQAYKRVISPKIASKTGVYIYYHTPKGPNLFEEEFYEMNSVENVDISIYERIAKDSLSRHNSTSFRVEIHKAGWFVEKHLTIISGHGKYISGSPDMVDFISCSGEHIFSPVTSAIPFVEFNDASRNMMGSVMSKQAIPIYGKQKQLVKTPLADLIGPTATGVIVAPYDLEVLSVDALFIKVRNIETEEIQILPCLRQDRTSKTTLNKSIPIARVGEIYLKGEVLADSTSTCDGELAHGTSLLMGIIPLYGHDFEDGVIISDRLVREDIFTSFHIEETVLEFIKDDKDSTNTQFVDMYELQEGSKTKFALNRDRYFTNESNEVINEVVSTDNYDTRCIIKRGVTVKNGDTLGLQRILQDDKQTYKLLVHKYHENIPGTIVDVKYYPPEGAKVTVVIKVAVKLKVTVGDKYTGRHGNKGIICKILPEEDMPFLEDGRRLDIVVTPLGLPSRMNIGQLFDGNLGLLMYDLGFRAIVKSFGNINSEGFKQALKFSGYDKIQLYDGRTGEKMRYKSTVAMPYVEKLEHVVSHKIHARHTGAYTVRKQPTQGKAQNGGQRLGEMEFWSLGAHGAVNVQKELTQFKSDDEANRNKLYKKNEQGNIEINKNVDNLTSNVPYAYKLIDNYFKATYKRRRYYDNEGNEIDILSDANCNSQRKLKETLAKRKSCMETEKGGIITSSINTDTVEDYGLDLSNSTFDDFFETDSTSDTLEGRFNKSIEQKTQQPTEEELDEYELNQIDLINSLQINSSDIIKQEEDDIDLEGTELFEEDDTDTSIGTVSDTDEENWMLEEGEE